MNIQNESLVDGNPKLTLGLVWTLILHFQVEMSVCVCVCVCVGVGVGGCVCVRACMCTRMCTCVCMQDRAEDFVNNVGSLPYM